MEPVRRKVAHRGGRLLALPVGPVPAGRGRADDRRADQRQRLQGVPRGDAAGPLGRLRGDRPQPDPRRLAHARRLHRLRRPGRQRRHARDRRPVRHRLDAAADARLDRAAGDRGRAGDARRPLRGQLGQLRGRRRSRLPVRPGDADHQGARRRGRGHVHRRGGPGPHRRLEGRRRRPDDPRPDRELGHAGRGHHRRLPDLPDRHRAGGDPPRRHRDHRGHPRAQAALPGGADHAGRLQRLVRAQPGRPPGAQLGLPARVRQRRAGLGDRARVEDPADVQDRGRAARGRARPGLRPPPRGLRPAAAVPGSCSRASAPPRRGSRGPRSWPRCRCPSGWSGGSSTASATGWRPTSTRRCRPGRRWRSSTTRCWPA